MDQRAADLPLLCLQNRLISVCDDVADVYLRHSGDNRCARSVIINLSRGELCTQSSSLLNVCDDDDEFSAR